MKTTLNRLLNVRTGEYIKSVHGSASWRARTGVHVEFTKNPAEAATFTLGRATSLARGKVANRVNWKDIKVEEIVVDVVIEDVVRASDAELAKARVVFENILKEMKANFRKERTDYYNRLYTKLAAVFPSGQPNYSTAHDAIEKAFPGHYDIWSRMIARDFIVKVTQDVYDNKYELVAEGRKLMSIIKSKVDTDERNMFEAFIQKQTEKVAAIIKARGLQVTGHVRGNLECEINFVLADGTKFDMTCQVVWKTSVLGKLFWQFPTTFHNVYTADGTAVSTPSEAKLKKVL
jgi:hypothetical protein